MKDLKTHLLAMALISIGLLAAMQGCSDGRQETISPLELERIKAGDQAYATAWLANDSAQVMATLTTDAVIVPSGMPVFEGQNAIREFWWPKDSPSTKVTEFTLVQHEVGGQGDLGFVRGSFSLTFDYDGKSYTSGGEYFSLLRRGGNGSWRISHRMWSDRPLDIRD